MGNEISTNDNDEDYAPSSSSAPNRKKSSGYAEFFTSAGKTIGEASGIVCGSINDTFQEGPHSSSSLFNQSRAPGNNNGEPNQGLSAGIGALGVGLGGATGDLGDDLLCGNGNNHLSPKSHPFVNVDDDASLQTNPMSALFARAMLNEVTDNPATMLPNDMAAREKKLMMAQQKAKTASKNNLRAVGGQGTIRGQLNTFGNTATSRMMPPSMLSENRAQVRGEEEAPAKHRVTIGLMLSRRDAKLGHTDTITRQTAFDFNELQDRQYKYVSSTDSSGWRAGGGESGKAMNQSGMGVSHSMSEDDTDLDSGVQSQSYQQSPKLPAQDTVHIPIIHIDCESSAAIDSVIAALARGEVFIPHMSILPEALGVNGISPPDLVVRFGCERNEDMPPEQWPNWCLEFMHNQLYDYFSDIGAKWMKRPFQITLAKKVRWKTVKHMNKFFSHSENVINSWREKGPQHLHPHASYIEGGASPEEVARPHGIYLLRNGKPTNYFAPNFEPPYTTKMTRSLLLNVMGKSWDRKRRDWSNEPLARVTTSLLMSTMCGCAEPNDGGFIAREVTRSISPYSVKSRNPSFFNGDKTSPNKADYSPFKPKKKHVIQPQLAEKAQQQHKRMYEGLKILREDSGITRSEIDEYKEEKNDERRGRSVSSVSSSSKVSKSSTDSSKQPKLAFDVSLSPGNESNSLPDRSEDEMSTPLHEEDVEDVDDFDVDKEFDWTSPNEKIDLASNNDFDNEEEFVIGMKTPSKLFSPSEKETPLINNHHDQRNRNMHVSNVAQLETYIKEESRGRRKSRASRSRDEDMGFAVTQSHQDAAISVGESQTTVPIMNGSFKLIEQERERRKERELQREIEREKMDKLEKAIEAKRIINQEKNASTPQRDDDSNSKEKSSSEKKSSKKEKKAKKGKKKREKKEKRERERSNSRSGEISHKIGNSNEKSIDWSMESLSQQAVKENYPMKNETQHQPVKENGHDSKSKKSNEWTKDSSYLPINLKANPVVNNSPARNNRDSIFNRSSSSDNAPDLNSQVSLDYSLDTASLFDGSLLGGQFAGDSSVFTTSSDNKSLLSCVTRSTVHDMSGKNNRVALDPQPDHDDNDDISLSLMASSSSGMELIPTDEELFVIGWAKAMDPNSGSYYYFTLDRSKTVWDNPLSSSTEPLDP